MAPLIAELANLSFTSGVFPARYKTGRVVPLLKKPGLPVHDPANYRPVTNLCTFSKIFKKLFLAQLQPHVMQSGSYCKFQSAYRKGCSTETELVRIVSDIQRAGGEGQYTVLLALDTTAAFDALEHSTLLERARAVFGVSGGALDWMKSFVTGRSQFIAVGSEKSDTVACSSGVPQGSVLGLILFGMYVSPVGDVITQHSVSYHQHADDLQLYTLLTPSPNRPCELSAIELCALDVSQWFTENALLLNPVKTEAVIFGTRQWLSQLDGSQRIDVAGTHIQFKDTVKLLSVTLDSTLCFDKHVADVARQCHYHIRALKHIRPLPTLEASRQQARLL